MTEINKLLRLGPRPRLNEITQRFLPVDTIMTLQKEAENVAPISQAASVAGYKWIWRPLDARPGVAQHSPVDNFMVAARLLAEELQSGRKVYLHCASGIHRTGMVAYTYYRYYESYGAEDARNAVITHRPLVTSNQDFYPKIDWMEGALRDGGFVELRDVALVGEIR